MVLKTALTEMLGIQHPIIQGGMQYIGYAEMASAVSNAGGLGILTGLTQPSPEALRDEIRRCRTMTDKPFGVNLTILPALIPADYDGYVDVVVQEKVAMLEVAGGSPKKYIAALHAAGVKVLHKSATVRHALKAQEAGVDLIEVVGYEASIAGGQPGDEIGAWVMLPKAVQSLKVPVIASGASATGRQLAAAIAMGAHGVTMATRFMVTVEAPIRQEIKEHLASDAVDERSTTVVLSGLSNATRVFKNDITVEMNNLEKEMAAQGGVDFSKLAPLAAGARTKKMWQETGDWNDSMFSAGQSLGLIHDIPTCKELVDRMVAEAESQLKRGVSLIASKL
eukprot:gnl/TRDRNA2_/TRDRNA2_82122_c0_seq1.p1 gnl/TRDRNA2_/TRDRNA2_82122_c0~~gnl/TRDRNA2_/TRDRNA2_82122_c0_seq1.p1  ORF type:complete len:337 (-),score=75.01 gnl/TRDRNA2_/TRDRNA2_82122_c0_seq1:91-1101(-)